MKNLQGIEAKMMVVENIPIAVKFERIWFLSTSPAK